MMQEKSELLPEYLTTRCIVLEEAGSSAEHLKPLYLGGRAASDKPLLGLADAHEAPAAVAPVGEGPVVGVSGAAAPYGDGDAAAAAGTGVRRGEVSQAGDEAADGAVAVGPADQLTQAVRGGLERHDGEAGDDRVGVGQRQFITPCEDKST